MWENLEHSTEVLLRKHQDELVALAEALLEHNSLTTKQVAAILGPNKPEAPPELLPTPPAGEPPAIAAPQAAASDQSLVPEQSSLPADAAAR